MNALGERLRLLVVTDRRRVRSSLVEVVRSALRGGATAVQLREKDLGARDLLDVARALREVTARAGALFIVNDRVDVALAAGADGVQLGWRSLPVEEVRRLAGRALLIGASTHDAAEVAAAEKAGADFVTFGPVYATPSKEWILAPRGCRRLAAVARDARVPVIALGGIREGRVADVRATGAAGIAVLSRIMASRDPEAVARLLAVEWSASAMPARAPTAGSGRHR